MSNQTPPTPAPAPKGPSLIEYAVIIILAAAIVTIILFLVWPSLTTVLGAIIAGF